MNSHAYTEDQLVEQPAIWLFAVLGWQTVSALEETSGPDGTLGRETEGEVVLEGRLRDVHWFIICQLSGNMGTPLFLGVLPVDRECY